MAADEASIFKIVEKIDEEIYTVFLNLAAEKLHTQRGILAPLFHPLDFFRPEKPFWERAVNSLIEEDEKTRFAGWQAKGVALKELNEVLVRYNTFPVGIEFDDFTDFLYREDKTKIVDYLLCQHRPAVGYALQEDLLNSMGDKEKRLENLLKPFCEEFKLDLETLRQYEELSHLAGAELPPLKVKADDKKEEFQISAPKQITINETSDEQKQKFLACKEILFAQFNDLNKQKDDLEDQIRSFCKKNSLDLEDTISHIKQIIGLESQGKGHEVRGLAPIIAPVKALLMLEEQINKISLIKETLKELKYIDSYQEIIDRFKQEFGVDPNFAKKIVAICGYGLNNSYIAPLNEQQYRLFLERKIDTQLIKMKNDIYYKTAEKGIIAINPDHTDSITQWLISALEYLVRVIELAPYEVTILNSERIDYTISVNIDPKTTQILKKQTRIPESLYSYYLKLKALIAQAYIGKKQNFFGEITQLLLTLTDDSLHHHYHKIFLALLQGTIKLMAFKQQQLKEQKSEDSIPPFQGYEGGFSPTFISEDERRRAARANPAASASSTSASVSFTSPSGN